VRYGDLLAAQYTNPLRMAFHQLVVDTYAVQHPDGDDARAIQSVGTEPSLGTRLHRRMVDRSVFHQLDSPPSRGRLTMLDVPLEGDAADARAAAYTWAHDVWTAWETHHQTVREWVAKSGFGS